MNKLKYIVSALTSTILVSCGGNSDTSSPLLINNDSTQNITDTGFSAPADISGNSYLLSIERGIGLFASSGTFLIRIADNQNTYERIIVSGPSSDATGTYSYSPSGTQGIIIIDDSVLGRATIGLYFTSSRSGTYVVTVESDLESTQSGTFEHQGSATSENTQTNGDVQSGTGSSSNSSSHTSNNINNGDEGIVTTFTPAVWSLNDQGGGPNTVYVTNDQSYSQEYTSYTYVSSIACYFGPTDWSSELDSDGDSYGINQSGLFYMDPPNESRVIFQFSGVALDDIVNNKCTESQIQSLRE